MQRWQDRLVGGILMVVAIAWVAAAATTIRAGYGGGVGPSAFPITLGIILAALAGLLAASSFRLRQRPAGDEPPPDAPPLRDEAWAISSTVGLLLGYTLLLYTTGFVVATVLTVACGFIVVLRNRNWPLIAATSFGLAFGLYLVFGKLLGVYLPHGAWLDLSL